MANFPGASNAIPGVYGPTYKDFWIYSLDLKRKGYLGDPGFRVVRDGGITIRFDYTGVIVFKFFDGIDEKIDVSFRTSLKEIWEFEKFHPIIVSINNRSTESNNKKFSDAINLIIKEIKVDQIISR